VHYESFDKSDFRRNNTCVIALSLYLLLLFVILVSLYMSSYTIGNKISSLHCNHILSIGLYFLVYLSQYQLEKNSLK
jgi:hypothetical protein